MLTLSFNSPGVIVGFYTHPEDKGVYHRQTYIIIIWNNCTNFVIFREETYQLSHISRIDGVTLYHRILLWILPFTNY